MRTKKSNYIKNRSKNRSKNLSKNRVKRKGVDRISSRIQKERKKYKGGAFEPELKRTRRTLKPNSETETETETEEAFIYLGHSKAVETRYKTPQGEIRNHFVLEYKQVPKNCYLSSIASVGCTTIVAETSALLQIGLSTPNILLDPIKNLQEINSLLKKDISQRQHRDKAAEQLVFRSKQFPSPFSNSKCDFFNWYNDSNKKNKRGILKKSGLYALKTLSTYIPYVSIFNGTGTGFVYDIDPLIGVTRVDIRSIYHGSLFPTVENIDAEINSYYTERGLNIPGDHNHIPVARLRKIIQICVGEETTSSLISNPEFVGAHYEFLCKATSKICERQIAKACENSNNESGVSTKCEYSPYPSQIGCIRTKSMFMELFQNIYYSLPDDYAHFISYKDAFMELYPENAPFIQEPEGTTLRRDDVGQLKKLFDKLMEPEIKNYVELNLDPELLQRIKLKRVQLCFIEAFISFYGPIDTNDPMVMYAPFSVYKDVFMSKCLPGIITTQESVDLLRFDDKINKDCPDLIELFLDPDIKSLIKHNIANINFIKAFNSVYAHMDVNTPFYAYKNAFMNIYEPLEMSYDNLTRLKAMSKLLSPNYIYLDPDIKGLIQNNV